MSRTPVADADTDSTLRAFGCFGPTIFVRLQVLILGQGVFLVVHRAEQCHLNFYRNHSWIYRYNWKWMVICNVRTQNYLLRGRRNVIFNLLLLWMSHGIGEEAEFGQTVIGCSVPAMRQCSCTQASTVIRLLSSEIVEWRCFSANCDQLFVSALFWGLCTI